MASHLTEEEQIEALKRWWKENGMFTVGAIVVAVAGYFGWESWKTHEVAQKEGASNLFQSMIEAGSESQNGQIADEDADRMRSLGSQLKDEYSGSFYSTSAALLMAKLAAEDGNLEEAKLQLEWAKTDNANEKLNFVIDQRLARVLYAMGEYDKALALVKTSPEESAKSSYAEIRGDIFAAQNKSDEAAKAYQIALDNLPESDFNRRRFIDMKLSEQRSISPELAEAE
ncbi:YfgM family protein [Sessilibacter corallicola]|uniref:Ancillary SecYEG translocon subunit n=1 Tax=Sessilibacter corallicola TaxID=2904075 RepID=A0ABQ0A9S6_9GAMM